MTDDEKSESLEDLKAQAKKQIARMLEESIWDTLYDVMVSAHYSGDHDRRNELLGELGILVEEFENSLEKNLKLEKESPEWQEMSNVEKAEFESYIRGENPDYYSPE